MGLHERKGRPTVSLGNVRAAVDYSYLLLISFFFYFLYTVIGYHKFKFNFLNRKTCL